MSNLFDQATWTSIGTAPYRDSLVIPGGQLPAPAFFGNAAGFDTVAIMAAANAASASTGRRSPLYKLPAGFQNPRSIRLFAKFTF